MMKTASIILCLLTFGGLASCSIPTSFNRNASGEDINQHYQAVSELLTQTARAVGAGKSGTLNPAPNATADVADPSAAALPVVTASLAVTSVPLPVVDNKPSPAPGNTAVEPILHPVTPVAYLTQVAATSVAGKEVVAPCDLVQPGRTLDITVPDDTRFYPGEYFSKTWRLVNAGSCPWTRDYAVVWFSGNDMGINRAQSLGVDVPPGASVDITVDMIAPEVSGAYQSNWKMRNPQGNLFGIGPKGDAPFWVRIMVAPLDTSTPVPMMPTVTPTPVVFASGTVNLAAGDEVDMDSGQAGQAGNDDLAYQSPAEKEGQAMLAPLNGARLATYGYSAPQLVECQAAALSETPLRVEQGLVGAYLCYRTNKGLPGWLFVQALNPENSQLNLQFVTWAVP